VKFFNAVGLFARLAEREWLSEVTKSIGQFWQRQDARRWSLKLANRSASLPAAQEG